MKDKTNLNSLMKEINIKTNNSIINNNINNNNNDN